MSSSSSGKYELPRNPKDLLALAEKAWNAGDFGDMYELYEPSAVLVGLPGVMQPLSELRESGEKSPAQQLSAEFSVRHVYEVGDIALIIADYVHEGTGPDGEPVRLEGTATDVVRRGPDGIWRCVISNPAGIGQG